MRRRSTMVAAFFALVAVLGGLIGNIATNNVNVTPAWRPGMWVATGVFTLLFIVGGLIEIRRSDSTDGLNPDRTLVLLADRLAKVVGQQWSQARRELNERLPIKVRWRAADSGLFMDWPVLVELATSGPGFPVRAAALWADEPDGLAGSANELVEAIDRVPTGRLVVLGDPGSGKTVLLTRLVLDLLSRRAPGDPVPIMLPLSSWNPVDEDLDSWVERSLIENHPELGQPVLPGQRINAARAVTNAGLLDLLLDGLDELSEGVRGRAIARLNRGIRPGQRLIITARTAEYRRAVSPLAGSEVLLTGAAGVEVAPLQPTEVADYLFNAAGPATRARWAEVLSTLATNPAAAVSLAFTTPFMVDLARTVYEAQPDDPLGYTAAHPSELTDHQRFPTRDAIEQHLLDHYLPAVYQLRREQTITDHWTADQGRRWLGFLARHLRDGKGERSAQLAWWNLHWAAPRWLSPVAVGLVTAAVIAPAFPFVGAGVGFIAAFAIGLPIRHWFRLPGHGLPMALAGGILGGLVGGLLGLAVFGPGEGNARLSSFIGNGLVVGIIVGSLGKFVAAFAAGLVGQAATVFYEQPSELVPARAIVAPLTHLLNGIGVGIAAGVAVALLGKVSPARRLRWSWGGFASGTSIGVLTGISVGAQSGIRAGVLTAVVASLAVGCGGAILFESRTINLATAASPSVVLRNDRATFWTSFVGFGTVIGGTIGMATALSANAVTGVTFGPVVGVKVGIADFIVGGLAFAFVQAAWGSYVITRCWLALSRQLPWRLGAFLADAHVNRGLLRQAGAVYEFRHDLLRQRLSSTPVLTQRTITA
jgi:GTPase SAR1 family protein